MASKTAAAVISAFLARQSRYDAAPDWQTAGMPDVTRLAYRIGTNGETLWSYGEHFPVAFWLPDGRLAITESRYAVPGERSRCRQPKYSVVTARQTHETRAQAAQAGYLPTGETLAQPWPEPQMMHASQAAEPQIFDVYARQDA